MAMNQRNLEFEQGWDFLQWGITKLEKLIEGLPEPQFTGDEYVKLYTIVYTMCDQREPYGFAGQLYDKYRETYEDCITTTVLPSLREKHDEFMLRELVKRWMNHKILVKWLSRFFQYLERCFVARRPVLPGLKEVGFTCFRELLYQELNGEVRDAVISLIDQEREGEQIDRAKLY